MTHAEFMAHTERLIDEGKAIMDAKRPAYTRGDDDVLANFKRIAKMTGMTPEQVLVVYWHKHWDAVITALLRPDVAQGEGIEGRLADLLNYLFLAHGLIRERLDPGPGPT